MKKIFLILILVLNYNLFASKIDDSVALNGIKEAKSVFLIDFTDIKTTAFYLKIIEGTYKGFTKQGVKPKMVLVFIGKTVNFLHTAQDKTFKNKHQAQLDSIQNSIKRFAKLGVRMEVCAIATKVFNIDNMTIPTEMNMIADGFISLIGWQTQGHKLVPIF